MWPEEAFAEVAKLGGPQTGRGTRVDGRPAAGEVSSRVPVQPDAASDLVAIARTAVGHAGRSGGLHLSTVNGTTTAARASHAAAAAAAAARARSVGSVPSGYEGGRFRERTQTTRARHSK